MTPSERCGWPLGHSENLSVTCARPEGHEGEHMSTFALAMQENSPPAPLPESETDPVEVVARAMREWWAWPTGPHNIDRELASLVVAALHREGLLR